MGCPATHTPMLNFQPPAPIELIVVDIDGTIAGRDNQVAPEVKAAIRGAIDRGVAVAVATGRMYKSALRFHHEIGATMPVMAYQGAWIQDPESQTLHRHLQLDLDLARELLDYFAQPQIPPDLSVHVYIDDRLYVQGVGNDTAAYTERSAVTAHPVADLRQVLTERPTKILAQHPDGALIDRLLQDLRRRYRPDLLHVTTSVPIFLEMTHPAVNKGTAIDLIARELLGIDASRVMAIGDNYNDVEMLRYAGWGVAMGNAPPAVQAQANWVAPAIEAHGVAEAIKRFVLI
jgi:Cof subfamily protein (haloacid dehalogenase superfamily)